MRFFRRFTHPSLVWSAHKECEICLANTGVLGLPVL